MSILIIGIYVLLFICQIFANVSVAVWLVS